MHNCVPVMVGFWF